jgi:AraC family transcriptional regulator
MDKIRTLAETPRAGGSAYLGALGVVLMHELARLYRSVDGGEGPARGGLAAWQERLVSGYIDEHVNEHIPLAALARLARLSPYHFSRAFKQSFGVPPHRYHTQRRIERAKALLESHTLSVTEIGLALGFSETSSFTAAFRKITGLTPTRYHRSVAYQPAQR